MTKGFKWSGWIKPCNTVANVTIDDLDKYWEDGDEQLNKRVIIGVLKARYAKAHKISVEQINIVK
jgi:hypothetical protein